MNLPLKLSFKMYVNSSSSEDFSCITIDSDKLLNVIVETFKVHKDHLTSETYPHNQYAEFF